MTDSLTTKVTSSPTTLPDTENPDIKSAMATPGGDERPPSDVIERTEVIRRFPTKVKEVFAIVDDLDALGECRACGAKPREWADKPLNTILGDEIWQYRLLDQPGLIKHLFPDEALPIPFESLKLVAKSKLWDPLKKEWKDHDPGSSSFFNCLSNTLIDAALTHPRYTLSTERFWSSECHLPPYGATNPREHKRKYGINLVDKKWLSSVTWSSTVVNVERRALAEEASEAMDRLIEGAAAIFHHQPERRFIISLSICGNEFRVYVFDRAGLVGSQPFHLRKDIDSLIRLMAGLALTDNSSLGFDPSIAVRVDRNGKISRTAVAGGETYELIKPLYVSHDLTGRGSVIWHARRENVDYVIKDTWIEEYEPDTTKESDLLNILKGVEGLTQLVSQETMKLPGGRVDDTTHLRRFLEGQMDSEYKAYYDKLPVRVHNRIVTTPLAQPLRTFRSKRELLTVLIDAIETHRRLVGKKILHCDISPANILIHRESLEQNLNPIDDPLRLPTSSPSKEPRPPRAKGILIDLDSAIITHGDDGKPTSDALSCASFTGTIPYASVEVLMGLLPGKIREAHHDLESFFYILLWFSLQYAGPNGLKRKDIVPDRVGQMRLWVEGGNHGNPREMGEAKYTTMTTTRAHFRRIVTGKCTPYFQDLVPCIEELWLKFFPKETRSNEGADYAEDVRPRVTHQEVADVLRKPLEWLPEVDEFEPDKIFETKACPTSCLNHDGTKRKSPHDEDAESRDGYERSSTKRRRFINNLPSK